MAGVSSPLLLSLAVFAGACATTTNQTADDGGTREPDGATPDGGVGTTAPCEVDGYPCAPGAQSQTALELSEEYKGEIQARREDGDSYIEVAEWLREQPSVVDVVAAEDRLRFRVEGGSAHWAMAIGREYPEMPLPPFSEGTASVEAPLASANTLVQKRVLREDGSDTQLKKKALIVEPFRFQLASNAEAWKARLEELHDYERVDHLIDDTIPDDSFANWNDYRFVWVLSHGAYLPDKKDPEYTAIFSAKQCGINRWLGTEIATDDDEDEETLRNGEPLSWAFGLPRPKVEEQLTADQFSSWRAFRDQELKMLTDTGRSCGNLDLDSLEVPGQGITRAPAFLDFIYYDKSWFEKKYPGGLDEVLLHLSVCSSLSVPNLGRPGSTSAIFGWTERVDAAQDDLTTAVLFDRLIENGETAQDAFDKLEEIGPISHQFEGKTTELKLLTFSGGGTARMRENISIIDPSDNLPLPDEGGTLDAREITTDGKTIVEAHLLISGFGTAPPGDFKVQIFDGDDKPLSAEIEVTPPIGLKAFLTVPFELNERVTQPKEIEIEARVSLPESTSPQKYGRHRIKATVLPVAETQWRITVGTLGSMEGPVILAPSVPGIPTEDGVEWTLVLTQEPPAVIPSASLIIKGHEGRRIDCTGQTGMFEGALGIVYTDDMNAPAFDGSGEEDEDCTSEVRVTIDSFSRNADLKLRLGGTLCRAEPDPLGEGVVRTPVGLSGWATWPRAGCGMAPPNDSLVGSYVSSENPFLCIDVYQSSVLALTFNGDMGLCAQPMVTCSPRACSTDAQVGRCDYRGDSAQSSFRGLVQHFQLGGAWSSALELALTCDSLGGTWTGGM